MGSCGGFSGFKSAKACLSALLLMTCPSAQSHGLPVLGHTCKVQVTPGCQQADSGGDMSGVSKRRRDTFWYSSACMCANEAATPVAARNVHMGL